MNQLLGKQFYRMMHHFVSFINILVLIKSQTRANDSLANQPYRRIFGCFKVQATHGIDNVNRWFSQG